MKKYLVIVQLELKIIHDWCKEVDLKLNSAQTVVVQFTKRYKVKGMRPILLLGNTIAQTKSYS